MQIDSETYLQEANKGGNHTQIAAQLNAKGFKTSKGKAWTGRTSWEYLRKLTHPNSIAKKPQHDIEKLVLELSKQHTSLDSIALILRLRNYLKPNGKIYTSDDVRLLLINAKKNLHVHEPPPCHNAEWLQGDYTNYYRRQEYPWQNIAPYPAPKGNEQLVGNPFFDVCAKTNTLI